MYTGGDERDLYNRAMAAYWRSETKRIGEQWVDQPAGLASGVESVGDMDYVVLRNGNATLAVYRVRNDGMLKRLKRWPAELEENGA